MAYPKLIENVINQFSKLPGIGRRSAERIVFWMLKASTEEIDLFTGSINKLKEGMGFCRLCNNFSEGELCGVCRNPARDRSLLCIVESPKDVIAIEKTGSFKGIYYVLLGAISPAEGRGPEDLNLNKLIKQIKVNDVKEIIVATDADTEGEMTAIHIQKELRPLGIKISRIGLGLPVGSMLEYADLSTLTMSMSARREM